MVQRYLRVILLFGIILVSDFASGQLKPFEDYSTCKTGLLRRVGDTLFPAKFENLLSIRASNLSFDNPSKEPNWILSEDGKFGCLSFTGKWLIECKYESLRFNTSLNVFVAKLNGKFGVVSMDNKVIVPFEFKEIPDKKVDFESYKTILVKKEGYDGLYSLSGIELVPPIYDQISFLKYKEKDYYRYNENVDGKFLRVELNGKVGIRSVSGAELSTVTYSKIDFFEVSPAQTDVHYFLAKNENGEQTVMNADGKMLFPFVKAELTPVYEEIHGNRNPLKYVQAEENKTSRYLISLSTGKRSETFRGAKLIQNCVIIYQEKNVKVLDADLKELYADSSKYLLYRFESDFINYDPKSSSKAHSMMLLASYDSIHPEDVKDCMSTMYHRERRKDYCSDCSCVAHSAMLDLNTGKRTDFNYSEIRVMEYEDEYFYWAFYDRDGDVGSARKVDIYNAKGKKKKQLIVYGKVDYCRENANPLIYANNNSQYLLYDISGNLMTDTVFDFYPETLLYQNEKKAVIAQREEKDNVESVRFYDLNKKPLLEGRAYQDYEREYRDNKLRGFNLKLNYLQNTILSDQFEVMLDSCSVLQHIVNYEIKVSGYDKCYLTTKGEYAYIVQNWKVHVLDSTFFKYGGEMISLPYPGGNLTIDRFGKIIPKVIEVRKVEDMPVGAIYFNFAGDTLIVKDSYHKELHRVPNYRQYHDGGPWLNTGIYIKLKNKQIGYLSRNTGEWIVEPKNYKYLSPFQTGREDKFWVIDPAIDSVRYTVVDSKGDRLTEYLFDEPAVFAKNQFITSFKFNKLIGIIDSNFHICTEAAFDNYFHSEHGYGEAFLFKDTIAFMVDQTTGKYFPFSGQFLNKHYSHGHILFRNDSIQILKSNGTPATKFITVKYAIDKLDLVKMLMGNIDTEGQEMPYITIDDQIVYEKTNGVLRKLNNRLLMEHALAFVTTLETLSNSYNHCSIRPLWISQGYYSEELKGTCYVHSNKQSVKQYSSYRNYFIGKDSLELLELPDLFKPNSNYELLLDSLIEKEIQRKQFFGTACPDMSLAIAEFKRNFFVDGTKIHFLHYNGMHELAFELKQFQHLLLHPEYFSLNPK